MGINSNCFIAIMQKLNVRKLNFRSMILKIVMSIIVKSYESKRVFIMELLREFNTFINFFGYILFDNFKVGITVK